MEKYIHIHKNTYTTLEITCIAYSKLPFKNYIEASLSNPGFICSLMPAVSLTLWAPKTLLLNKRL